MVQTGLIRQINTIILITFLLLGDIESSEEPKKQLGEDGYPTPTKITEYIVGGLKSKPNQWPWLVQIMYDEMPLCGGAIIDESWILTAAHCFQSSQSPILKSASRTTIIFGDERVSPDRFRMTAAELILYESYNYTTLLNDIALVRLPSKLDLDSKVSAKSIRIYDGNERFEGKLGTVVGRGKTATENKFGSDGVQHISVPIMDDSECDKLLQKRETHKYTRPLSGLCAGFEEGGKDSCFGDSGGPLSRESKNTRPVLVGIVSGGPEICGLPKAPGIYTNVSLFKEWIEAKVNYALILKEDPPDFNTTTFKKVLTSVENSGLSSGHKVFVSETLLMLLPLKPRDYIIMMAELELDYPVDVESALEFSVISHKEIRYGVWVFKCGMFKKRSNSHWGYISQLQPRRYDEDGETPDSKGSLIKFVSYRCPSIKYNLGKQPYYMPISKDVPELHMHTFV